jgi:hypothetical protein
LHSDLIYNFAKLIKRQMQILPRIGDVK